MAGPSSEKLYRKNPKHSDNWKIAVIILKFEQWSLCIEQGVQNMQTEWQTEQTLSKLLRQEHSDQGLHCLPRSACLKT